jgi:predicted PurR-regulated permease PerM
VRDYTKIYEFPNAFYTILDQLDAIAASASARPRRADMSTSVPEVPARQQATVRTMEITIRIALILGLAIWCFRIVEPFLSTIVWAIITAIALFPAFNMIQARFPVRRKLVATAFTGAMLLIIMTPVLLLSGTLVETARSYAKELQAGTIEVPAPPERIQNWPVIGEPTYNGWELAHDNLTAAIKKFEPQIKVAGSWLISTATGAGLGMLQFAISIIISGFFLAWFERCSQFAHALGHRLADQRGEEFVQLASSTVRSVAQGILGVAFIQAILAGLGFLAVGLPGAGLWTLIALITATVQLGVGLVVIPSVIYIFSTADTTTAFIYLAWAIFVTLIDNILKPILLGRGARVPMAVIFVGSIGGFILSGIVGLFVGAVVLGFGYETFKLWLNQET